MKKLISILLTLTLLMTSAFALAEEINVISREDGSGTRGAFIELFGIEQKSLGKRLWVSIPLFVTGLFIIFALPFQTIWSYFAWCNQTLAVITLWCITVYLAQRKQPTVIGAVPALMMTYVCSAYIFISPMMCNMENRTLAYILAGVLTLLITVAVYLKGRNTT